MRQSYITLLLARDVLWHPRGFYRLAQSLARLVSIRLVGLPMPSVSMEGPLIAVLDRRVWEKLTRPPILPDSLTVEEIKRPWFWQYVGVLRRLGAGVLVTEPLTAGLLRLLGRRHWIWDLWEDYGANFWFDPAYRLRWRVPRQLIWQVARGSRPLAYTLAEYAYAGLVPLDRSTFLPNAFVPVEAEPPLLPTLRGDYELITGNLTESWGLWEALTIALQKPTKPLVIAGSIKTPVEEKRLRAVLAQHQAWLWLRSTFVPYPVIQNLERHAALLYGLYQPLPHIRDKIPGKFYEAAALGVPLVWRKGISPIWDAFWKRYQDDPQAPTLYWRHYEPHLLEWAKRFLVPR